MLDKKKNKGNLKPYLRNINVRWGRFELSNVLEMRFEEHELKRYVVSKDDLVICEGGEQEFRVCVPPLKDIYYRHKPSSPNISEVTLAFKL